MPLVHVLWIRKDGPKGVRGSAASASETEDRIPPSPPVQPIYGHYSNATRGRLKKENSQPEYHIIRDDSSREPIRS